MPCLSPKNFPHILFGWKVLAVLGQTDRLNESLPSMQKAVELSPRDAELHSNLGITLQKLGKLDEAEEGFKRAIELETNAELSQPR